MFIVFADDILILCKTKQQSKTLYFDLLNHLNSIELDINKSKIQQDRFSSGVLDFVGYKFAGGRVGISGNKITAFKEDFAARCKLLPKPFNERAYVKNLNCKISGFGHYYKCADVVGLFEKLDSYIRANVRLQYKSLGLPYPTNAYLNNMGLSSLVAIKKKGTRSIIPINKYNVKQQLAREKHIQKTREETLFNYLEHFDNQNKEIIGLLKKMVKAQEELGMGLSGM